jgi:hypothetical protein
MYKGSSFTSKVGGHDRTHTLGNICFHLLQEVNMGFSSWFLLLIPEFVHTHTENFVNDDRRPGCSESQPEGGVR